MSQVGLRVREACKLDLADIKWNLGSLGKLHVRHGCATWRATGEPWCRNCRVRHIRCTSCGTVAPLKGGTLAVPLCAPCLNPDPDFWDRCPACETTWQFGTEPCQRCRVDQKLRELLGDGVTIAEELKPFRRALVAVERPDHASVWMAKPKVRALLTALGKDPRPVTHELLDELPKDKTLNYLRRLLRATGALPTRDQRLTKLERWINEKLATRTDLEDRRVLHGYAIRHHLRRLRQRVRGHQLTVDQDQNVRIHVNATVQFLDDLAGRGTRLVACTQSDVDDFMAHRATYPSADGALRALGSYSPPRPQPHGSRHALGGPERPPR
ncbi:hypothetical protein ACWGQL_37755 [Streptomyces lydicus]